MKTVLFTWELGQGLGHLTRLQPLARELARRGHRVVAAVKDVPLAQRVFSDPAVTCIPAPGVRPAPPRFEPARGWAHVLGNVGFSDAAVLAESFVRWNALFDAVRPDLLVADHSPRALLAACGRRIKRVNIGTGFFCPPPGSPMPIWSPGQSTETQDAVVRDEGAILRSVNGLLLAYYRRPLNTLSDLFNDLDAVFLTTYAELDHFGHRPGVRYWGHWGYDGGAAPIWPTGEGKKVFAYLKPFPALPALLRELVRLKVPAIVVAGHMDEESRRPFQAPTLRFESHPLDLRLVVQQCDVAIVNANHGTAASFLRAGIPCLMLPLFTEQALLAKRVQQIGAGLTASAADGESVSENLATILASGTRPAAKAFAARYATLQAEEQALEIVGRVEQLLGS